MYPDRDTIRSGLRDVYTKNGKYNFNNFKYIVLKIYLTPVDGWVQPAIR